MSKLLNTRQEAFCRHFCATGNAAASARKAGYSVNSARQMGHELLEKPWIIERVQEIREGWQATARAEAAVMLARLEQAWDSAVQANDGRGSPGHMLQVIRLQAEISGVIAKGAANRADLWDVAEHTAQGLARADAADRGDGADGCATPARSATPPLTPMQSALRHGRHQAERALAMRRTLTRSVARSAARSGAKQDRKGGSSRQSNVDPVQEVRGHLALTGEIENRRLLGRLAIATPDSTPDSAPDNSLTKPDIYSTGLPIAVDPSVTTAENAEVDAAEVAGTLFRTQG